MAKTLQDQIDDLKWLVNALPEAKKVLAERDAARAKAKADYDKKNAAPAAKVEE